MWQGFVAAILLLFGIIVAIVGVIAYLRMYRKQIQQDSRSLESNQHEN